MRNTVFTAAMLLAAGLAYVAGLHWQERERFERLPVSEDCDLSQAPCRRAVADGSVVFSISPDNIPLMQRLTLTVEVEGLAFNEAWVEIRGIDMDMGQNRTRLRNVDRATWVGETILPICSRRHMRWEAVIRFGEELNIEIPFRFATQRR